MDKTNDTPQKLGSLTVEDFIVRYSANANIFHEGTKVVPVDMIRDYVHHREEFLKGETNGTNEEI